MGVVMMKYLVIIAVLLSTTATAQNIKRSSEPNSELLKTSYYHVTESLRNYNLQYQITKIDTFSTEASFGIDSYNKNDARTAFLVCLTGLGSDSKEVIGQK